MVDGGKVARSALVTMRRSATVAGLSSDTRKPVDTCADYLLKYAPYLHYDRYLAAGYPIVSTSAEKRVNPSRSSTTTCRGVCCGAVGRGPVCTRVRGAAVKAVSAAKRGRSAATRLDGGEHTRTLLASTAPTDHDILWSTVGEKPAHFCARQHIATGVIEGACRYLVHDRMELTGARWRLVGAEAVLKLRARRPSGDFDAYWDFHEAREYERNHAQRYADGTAPQVSEPPPPPSPPRLRRVK